MTFLFPLSLMLADQVQETSQRVSEPTETTANGNTDRSFIITPIPISDPAIGTGLGLGGMVLYKPGNSAKPWTSGLGGLYTDSASWAVAAFQKAHFADDSYRLTALAGYGIFNIDFFGIGQDAGSRGISIGLEQEGAAALVDFLGRVRPHTYLGLRYRGATVNTKVDTTTLPFPDLNLPAIELESTISALGLAAEYDTRDSEYGPRKGYFAEAQWLFADEAFGSDFDYPSATAALNGYVPVGESTTLAWRGSLCWTGDGGPFYDLCNYGSQHDLRGYSNGQYRDHAMFAVQAEVRQHLFGRFGAVAFAGVGGVAPSFGDMDKLLPAAGIGLRFEASRQYRVNLSIDFAVGDDSNGFYFYVGEAF